MDNVTKYITWKINERMEEINTNSKLTMLRWSLQYQDNTFKTQFSWRDGIDFNIYNISFTLSKFINLYRR